MFDPYAAYSPLEAVIRAVRFRRVHSSVGSVLTAGATRDNEAVTRIVIVGGGPAGYESALVAAQLGATVTVIDRDGLGGSCVLTDCVPS
ncbi:MAG: hypothetical protein QOH52_1101 [Pseudonocardiales bacterium]|nr:hypothetical protein [Pseudonocardiales bacterium]